MHKKSWMLARYPRLLVLLLFAASFSACGGDNTWPAGEVVQGPVKGATVFPDHTTGPNANNRKMDADEASYSTSTDDTGHFRFTRNPDYPYIAVSVGGTDTITGKTAMQMLATSDANNISPLTTLVALNPAAKTIIEALGVRYDEDISKKVTPAALLLIQSVQTVLSTTIDALNPGGNKLTVDQISSIERTIIAQIAAGIQNQTTSQLTTLATLTTTLNTAVKTGLDLVVAAPANANITIPNTQTLANAIVSTTLINSIGTAISPTGTFSTDQKDATYETSLVTSTDATAINTVSTTEVATITTTNLVTVTVTGNHAPVISGTPATTVAAGATYTFAPTASDADNNTLVFAIVNKPTWATFNTGTGVLTGRPATTNAGTTSGIVISVSDGITTILLPAFSVTVTATTGTGGTGGTVI